jgi:hypothetical protein
MSALFKENPLKMSEFLKNKYFFNEKSPKVQQNAFPIWQNEMSSYIFGLNNFRLIYNCRTKMHFVGQAILTLLVSSMVSWRVSPHLLKDQFLFWIFNLFLFISHETFLILSTKNIKKVIVVVHLTVLLLYNSPAL